MIYLVALYVLSSLLFMCFVVWRDLRNDSHLCVIKTVMRDRDNWEDLFKRCSAELQTLKAKISSEAMTITWKP